MPRFACVSVLLMLVACSPALSPTNTVSVPAGPGSAQPHLVSGADGRLYLSWIEPTDDDGHALRFSVWKDEAWAEPGTIARGSDWFVNWADFPSVAAHEDGTLAAHWLAKSGPGNYAYDVRLSVSRDGGTSWSEPVTPHGDGVPTEHGFVSLVPGGDGFDVIWLDGRDLESRGNMTLRHASLDREGRVGAERVVDDRVCECCATDAARAADGDLLVVYRDRSDNEIRDIYTARLAGNEWSQPLAVHDDGWKISGCPVNGPAVDAGVGTDDETAVSAWFTAAEEERGKVLLAFSGDGGRSFAAPLRIDDGEPFGCVDVALDADGSANVIWLEENDDGATVQTRRVDASGRLGEIHRIALTAGPRSTGFPQLARHEGRLFAAWTDTGEPTQVRSALLP